MQVEHREGTHALVGPFRIDVESVAGGAQRIRFDTQKSMRVDPVVFPGSAVQRNPPVGSPRDKRPEKAFPLKAGQYQSSVR